MQKRLKKIKGIVETEAFTDPLVINLFDKIKLNVEYHSESKTSKIWHVCRVEVEEQKTCRIFKKISKTIKNGWFALFWDKEKVVVIMKSKIFTLFKQKFSEEEYKRMEKHALSHDIQKKYLSEILDKIK